MPNKKTEEAVISADRVTGKESNITHTFIYFVYSGQKR